ncbi:hypothetical protein DFR58_14117 [Anaerobacterium chartisolvens]|uniref:FtsK gamma domain-containing protein n=1 Tax=Anaerobacterium chartisolvens TaxID=1297424 RepID=A0A369AMK1_9FIRM|nr:hypothetical protein [Anaerobacterium chartisolvens]RCX08674.1 hypothetical protein DFR58_14117 [Anaerobacterium chartisolvens]
MVEWWKEMGTESRGEVLEWDNGEWEVIKDDISVDPDEEDEENPEKIFRKNICDRVLAEEAGEEIRLPTVRDIKLEMNISKWAAGQILNLLKRDGWVEMIGETKNSKTVVVLSKEDAEKWLSENRYF